MEMARQPQETLKYRLTSRVREEEWKYICFLMDKWGNKFLGMIS